MARRQTTHETGDAPPSTAKDPNVAAAALAADRDADTLVAKTVMINAPRQALYDFWRDFRNLPLFMENIESVSITDGGRSHWTVKAPAGKTVEWDSIIVEDIPGKVIEWRSAADADVKNSGRIEFVDSSNDRGTWVTATIAYEAPAGALGRLVATLFGREPKVQARRDLRRFKQLMETGELATSRPPFAAPRAE
ncbi:MAG TPA: SRPBCC family protein [Steroidobacteraceae bacterium]|nr:SRPBCC family protein [Steroidobacteraceae bacterium]